MKAKIVKSFEKVFAKNKNNMTLRQFILLAEQLVNYGYCVELSRDGGELKTKPVEDSGFIESMKRSYAEKNNIDLNFTA